MQSKALQNNSEEGDTQASYWPLTKMVRTGFFLVYVFPWIVAVTASRLTSGLHPLAELLIAVYPALLVMIIAYEFIFKSKFFHSWKDGVAARGGLYLLVLLIFFIYSTVLEIWAAAYVENLFGVGGLYLNNTVQAVKLAYIPMMSYLNPIATPFIAGFLFVLIAGYAVSITRRSIPLSIKQKIGEFSLILVVTFFLFFMLELLYKTANNKDQFIVKYALVTDFSQRSNCTNSELSAYSRFLDIGNGNLLVHSASKGFSTKPCLGRVYSTGKLNDLEWDSSKVTTP